MNVSSLIALLLPLHAAGVISSTSIQGWPVGVVMKGDPVLAKKWTDSQGENYVVLSSLSKKDPRSGERSAYLYGTHWRKVDGSWQTIWTMNDRVERCDLDISCEFAPGSLEITDLDGNGIAEVSFLYRLGCPGDISPDTQKLLLYEGKRKHAMRGTEKVILPTDHREDVMGGEYKSDKAFDKAPPAFLKFAREQWAKLGVRRY
jgi:hypothetical protein